GVSGPRGRVCKSWSLGISNISDQTVAPGRKPAPRRSPRSHRPATGKKNPGQVTICSFQNRIIIFTCFLFILAVTAWALMWFFIHRTESTDVLYFVGLFRIANLEFLPEHQHKESQAQNVQQVMNMVYSTSVFSKFYKQAVVSDVSCNNHGGLLVHFWIVFVAPAAKGQIFCEACVAAILKDSIQTSVINRTSIGNLKGLAVDMDSVVLNAGLRADYSSSVGTDRNCVYDLYMDRPLVRLPLEMMVPSGRCLCHFKVTATTGYLVRLSLESTQMEADNCITNSLTIYDALVPIKSLILYRICEPIRKLMSFISTNNLMLVTFQSSFIRRPLEIQGYFEIIPEETCGNTISAQESGGFRGTISSPYFPSFYPPKCNCTWDFQTPHVALGLALKFHNYKISKKTVKSCDHGWWEINEHMYCGYYIDHWTVFRVPHSAVHIQLQCSAQFSEAPFLMEFDSYNISQPCPAGQFQCSSGLCVLQTQRCDGVNDCFDESDELFCGTVKPDCHSNSFWQESSLVCDGFKDCDGGWDEQNCTQRVPCGNDTFQCHNNDCFRKRNAKCDGTMDCLDGSDEEGCGCGGNPVVPWPRIVGGTVAPQGQWPWQASLHFVGSASCGASVITQDWLLSAAHCFQGDRLLDPRPWLAHLGMYTQGEAKFTSPVRRIVVHEFYDSRTFDYDIALLQLSSTWPAALAQQIQPICIPPLGQRVRSGERCWVTGWGQRHEADSKGSLALHQAEVEVVDQTLCVSTYGLITVRMLCAGARAGGSDACKGDSGGPLSCRRKSDGKWILTGIVSWGYGCGRPNFPGVYTRVSNFIPWIHRYIPSV
uniref:Transmembrane serine protease 7 n=1 Tax=Ornithorhynchus anatinus TaxID=9258 RepID=F7F214_ORNAN